MKEKLFSFGDDFRIQDESGRDVFFVDGKMLSIGDKLSFQDMQRNELAFIRQKLLALSATYEVYRKGNLCATVKKELFTLLHCRFFVDVPGPDDLEASGNLLEHEYTFRRHGTEVASVLKKWFSLTDSYGVDISPGEDDVLILASTVVIDMACHRDKQIVTESLLLDDVEVRVLGALIEKEITTPDYYPLSLNSLVAACNQSSNRHPVVHYDEDTVIQAADTLREKQLVHLIARGESRVNKYRHVLYESMNLGRQEIAVLCVLLLRGPQTVGEIRTRSNRLIRLLKRGATGRNAAAPMMGGESPLVVRLARQTGQKEVRYAHLLSGEVWERPRWRSRRWNWIG